MKAVMTDQQERKNFRNNKKSYYNTVIIIHSQGGIQLALPVLLCSSWGVVVALLFCHQHGT